MYVEGNPVNYVDPSGHISEADDIVAQIITADLRIRFNVEIVKDWGNLYTSPYQTFINDLIDENGYDIDLTCNWRPRNWRNINELEYVRDGAEKIADQMGGPAKFRSAMKNMPVEVARVKTLPPPFNENTGLALPETFGYYMVRGIMLPDRAFNSNDKMVNYTTIHELGHAWDIRWNLKFSLGMAIRIGSYAS